MPTYVYACRACNETFEADQRIVEDALTTCILCGTEGSIKRVIQPVGIAFKGSGFYVNDSASSSKSSEPKKSEASAAPAETPAPVVPAVAAPVEAAGPAAPVAPSTPKSSE